VCKVSIELENVIEKLKDTENRRSSWLHKTQRGWWTWRFLIGTQNMFQCVDFIGAMG